MNLEPLFDHNAQHILAAVGQNGPLRFTQLMRWTGLDNKTLARKLKQLDEQMVIFTRTIPSQGTRIFLEYGLTPRGEAFYNVLEGMRREVINREKILGPEAVREAHEIFTKHDISA